MLAIVTSHPIQYQAPLWRALAAAGVNFEVWFLTPHAVHASPDKEFGRSFAWDIDLLSGYPHRFLPVAPGWTLEKFNSICLPQGWAAELRERKVTTLWIEGWRFRTLWQAAATAHGLSIPVWLRGESHDLAPEPWLKHRLKRIALGWLFRRVDKFLCIGSANRRFYRQRNIPEARLLSAPYGVDTERFGAAATELAPSREVLRRRWNIATDAYCVLFCGKLIAKKRPLDLVAATILAPRVADRPVHLLFAGDGELTGQLQTALKQPGAPAATFAGFLNQSEIPAALAVADCLVLPSDFGETWGLVVNEALASGVPVIVSDHCGCTEDLAAPLGAAHVFPCGDSRALAESLRTVAANPPPAATLRQLSESHSPQRTAENVVAALTARIPSPPLKT